MGLRQSGSNRDGPTFGPDMAKSVQVRQREHVAPGIRKCHRADGSEAFFVYHGKAYVGSYATCLEALAAKAAQQDKRRQPVALVPDSSSWSSRSAPQAAMPHRAKHKGVYYHRGIKRWVAQELDGTRKHLASGPTPALVVKALRASGKELTLRPKTKRVDLDDQVRRVKVFLKVYAKMWPADLESSLVRRRMDPGMRFQAPMLYQVSLRGKEGPWHEALGRAWMQTRETCPRACEAIAALTSHEDAECIAGASIVHRVLREALVAMQGVRRDDWIVNTGHNVSHHSGWLPLMQDYGMLRAARTAVGSRPRRLRLAKVTACPRAS